MAKNNSIVIGVRYNEYYNNGLTDIEWDKLHEKQISNLYDIMYDIELKIGDNLKTPLTIIQYNEFSVNVNEKEEEER